MSPAEIPSENPDILERNRAHDQMKGIWQNGWANPEYEPVWGTGVLPGDVRAAAESWFVPKTRLLDIGCGDGRISAELAGLGFQVTAIDYSRAAVQRARETYGESENLRFRCLDICKDEIEGQYDTLLDRGCLHGLLKDMYADYSRRVARASLPGARFLLLYAIHHRPALNAPAEESIRANALENIQKTLAEAFDIVQWRPIHIEKKPAPVPGIGLRLVRKEPVV